MRKRSKKSYSWVFEEKRVLSIIWQKRWLLAISSTFKFFSIVCTVQYLYDSMAIKLKSWEVRYLCISNSVYKIFIPLWIRRHNFKKPRQNQTESYKNIYKVSLLSLYTIEYYECKSNAKMRRKKNQFWTKLFILNEKKLLTLAESWSIFRVWIFDKSTFWTEEMSMIIA